MENNIIFKLNPKFYNKNIILETTEAFKKVCSAEFNEETFEICLKPRQECDLKELSLEFCNYCLGLMKW